MGEHTPGPWVWETVEGEQQVTEHSLKGPDVLCRYWHDKPPSADARLIASAPDMKAELTRLTAQRDGLVTILKKIVLDWDGEAEDIVDALIALSNHRRAQESGNG